MSYNLNSFKEGYIGDILASPENPMKSFLCKTTTDGLKDLPRKGAMVRAKGALDFAKGVS